MIEIGRLCVKIAGRDAGLKCAVIEILDKNTVLIDGQTRRRKCNIRHLEPLKEKIDLKDKADHASVVNAFKKLGMELVEKKSKAKTERPRKVRKAKPAKEEKPKKAAKVEKPKEEEKEFKEEKGSLAEKANK